MHEDEARAKLRELLTSADDVGYFFDQLTSPKWIPLLEQVALLADPPAPIENENGAMFPFWPVSRYLVRVADQAPDATADVLYRARDSRNPRVWWDTVDALAKMPAATTARFIPFIKRWVHHPWHLGLDVSTAKLIERLVTQDARESALELGTDLARLIPPAGWNEEEPWVPLDDYDYGELVPPTARQLATFGPVAELALVGELERFLILRYPEENKEGKHADLSFIWRPAIENHEQNWDHDRESKLVLALREGLEALMTRSPGVTEEVVRTLLDSRWPVVRRLGIHLLVVFGDRVPELVERALSDRDLLDDEHHRHELYRLAAARFATLPASAKQAFVDNVRSVATADAEAAAKRHDEGDRKVDVSVMRDVLTRRWLGAVADDLTDADRAELAAMAERLGEPETHPDFASYHMSWMGSTSPISSADLKERSPDDLVDFLASWKESDRFGPGPGVDGLAQQLTDAVAEEPERFAPLAPRLINLQPAYMGALMNGLQKALEDKKSLPWQPVLAAGLQVLRRPADSDDESQHHTWNDVRSSVARLLQRGFEGGLSTIPFELAEEAWSLLALLANDPEPTPADEARFGPPNMDPVTYSLNTVRSSGFHAIFRFLAWHRRHWGDEREWSLPAQLPETAALLDAHLDPDREPSVAVRAAYGWWLPMTLRLDRAWVAERAPLIVGRVSSHLERAAWEGFLFRGDGQPAQQEVFRVAYASFAEQLASLGEKPKGRGGHWDVVERFIDHLILPWLHHPELRDSLPLRTLLTSGQAWLVAEVVEEAGRLVGRTEAEQVTTTLANAFADLWTFVLEASSNLEAAASKTALAPFAWWFDSALPGDWALGQLLSLMERGILPSPAFAVFRRLPDLVAEHPAETLRVVEILVGGDDEDWSIRTQEDEIKAVLAASVGAEDEFQRERAIALVNQLVRSGLPGLASLVRP